MHKGYAHFVREIYSYCDNNIEDNALFPFFVNFWNENGEASYVTKKDLGVLTSEIIFRLLEKKVLIEIPKDDKSQNLYGLYKILPHENLVRQDDLDQKRMKLFK